MASPVSIPHRRLIGIGNEFRSDDGVGLAVARRLEAMHIPQLEILLHPGDGASLMELWIDNAPPEVYLVDAVGSGAPPGTIFRLDAIKQPIPTEFFSYSTHAFAVAEAVELCRNLGQLPPALYIYGIEGANFANGERLSPAIKSAAEELVEEIRHRFQPLE